MFTVLDCSKASVVCILCCVDAKDGFGPNCSLMFSASLALTPAFPGFPQFGWEAAQLLPDLVSEWWEYLLFDGRLSLPSADPYLASLPLPSSFLLHVCCLRPCCPLRSYWPSWSSLPGPTFCDVGRRAFRGLFDCSTTQMYRPDTQPRSSRTFQCSSFLGLALVVG